MCTVSMVYDEYAKRWPRPDVNTPQINVLDLAVREKTALDLFEELVQAAHRLDQALGLADCEDPKKQEWLAGIRDHVRAHEARKVEQRLGR